MAVTSFKHERRGRKQWIAFNHDQVIAANEAQPNRIDETFQVLCAAQRCRDSRRYNTGMKQIYLRARPRRKNICKALFTKSVDISSLIAEFITWRDTQLFPGGTLRNISDWGGGELLCSGEQIARITFNGDIEVRTFKLRRITADKPDYEEVDAGWVRIYDRTFVYNNEVNRSQENQSKVQELIARITSDAATAKDILSKSKLFSIDALSSWKINVDQRLNALVEASKNVALVAAGTAAFEESSLPSIASDISKIIPELSPSWRYRIDHMTISFSTNANHNQAVLRTPEYAEFKSAATIRKWQLCLADWCELLEQLNERLPERNAESK